MTPCGLSSGLAPTPSFSPQKKEELDSTCASLKDVIVAAAAALCQELLHLGL